MGIFAAAAGELRTLPTSNPRNPAYWLTRLFQGDPTASGVRVTDESALAVTTVFASCRNLAEDVGTLPFPVYEETTRGKVRQPGHSVHGLLNRQANPEMSATDMRQTLQGHAALRGNGLAEIEWSDRGPAIALWPLDPRRVRLVRAGRDVEIAGAPEGALVYLVTLPNGQEKPLVPSNVFHVKGWGNGLWGHSVLSFGREAIGLTMAAREYGARFFGNDARPGMYLKADGKVPEQTKKDLKASWEDAHRPLENKHRMAILEGGISLETVGMSPEDSQFTETRKHQRTELGELFRMPPDKLMDYERATFTNVEYSDLIYVKYTLRAWFVRWEQEANRKLLALPFMSEHVAEGLLRGDFKSRTEGYSALRAAGGITPNQIADRENLPRSSNPIADEILVPLNSVPASALDEYGMTLRDRVNMAGVLVRAGYERNGPNGVLQALGLPEIGHTGLVPITVQVDPSTLTDPTSQPGGAQP